MNVIEEHKDRLENLCRKHEVKKLFAFGSALREDFRAESDIDLVVAFNQIDIAIYADNYFELKFSLEDLFKRPVDLLEQQALKNPYFLQKLKEQYQLVYGD